MTVSAIRQSSPGRLTVCFEDGSEIKSTLAVVTDLRLYSGLELDEGRAGELRELSRRALARERALEYVSRRPMSQAELRKKLISKGEDEAVADYCVQWLGDNGFLNDEDYSRRVARHCAAKGYGQGRVRAELRRRGLDRELWDEAVEAMPDGSERLDKLVAARLKDPEDREQVAKLCQYLYRRGFDWDDVRAALNRYNAECEDE